SFSTTIDPGECPLSVGRDKFAEAFRKLGSDALSAEILVVVEKGGDGEDIVVLSLVNTSDPEASDDPRFYEAKFGITGLDTKPFLLDALEDSFRHDRRVPAYGINCGVKTIDGGFVTTDAPQFVKFRPAFWGSSDIEPDMSFAVVAR